MTLTSSASLHLMRSVYVCLVALIHSVHLNFLSQHQLHRLFVSKLLVTTHTYILDNDAVVWRLTDKNRYHPHRVVFSSGFSFEQANIFVYLPHTSLCRASNK